MTPIFLCLKFISSFDFVYKVLCVLGKLCSGFSYSVAGQEFNVNESIIFIK